MTCTKYKYDIFLSYSKSDLKSVEKVARYFSDAGLNVWFDEWSLIPGQQWKVSLKEALESSFVVAVFIGPSSLSNQQLLEWEIIHNKQMKGAVNLVIPILLPGSSIDFIPFSLREICALDLRKGLETSREINELVKMITENNNVTGGTGLTAGNDVYIGDITGQLAIGENINQSMINKNVTGGTGLTAGGKVTIGDVTGQLAIRDYINQFMIKEPSGEALIKLIAYLEQKRQEATNFEILNSYNPSALPDYSPKLKESVVRNRLEELNKALIHLQDHHILLLTGVGGVGKTTLARTLVELRPANVPLPFWFDFGQYKDAKVGDILEKLAAYMNSPDLVKFREEKREAGKNDIDKLIDKLEEGRPVWLVFDSLEIILDETDFRDEYIDLLFTCLRNNTHQTKIIIMSRVFPKLKSGENLIDVVEEEKQDLKGLKINFAVDYLVKNGLSSIESKKLEELATGVDGHPLSLKILVELVKKFGAADVIEDLSMYQKGKEDTILKARKLFDRLAGNEKELLERISVYRQAETMNAIKKMFTENTPVDAVDNLIDKSLLETDNKGNYWLHPLVQEFAYGDLENKIEIHKLAETYYLSLPLPEHPRRREDVQSLIEAHHHACMAGEYDQAFHIIFDNNLHEYLDLWGNYTLLIDLYSKLLPKDHFGKEILLKDKGNRCIILGNLGLAYGDLGDQKKSIEYHEKALEISREIGNRRGEEYYLGNLGLAYRYLGEPKKAIKYYEHALKISREIGDRRGEGAALGNLGLIYSDLGELEKAIEYHEQALKISREIGDRRGGSVALGNLGNVYSVLGESEKAIRYYHQALMISKEIGDRRGEGAALGNLGLIYSDLGELEKAIEYYQKALMISKEIGDRRGDSVALGNLGNIYTVLGDLKKAIEYHERALIISREIGDKRGEGAALGNVGLAYSDLGEMKKAIEYYKQALKIAREIDDRRGEGNHLGNLGKLYSFLGEPRKAVEYYEQALSIGKEIEDPRIINFCERNLEKLKDSKK